MDILYMQYTIIGVKKELLRLSLRLAQEFNLLNMRMASYSFTFSSSLCVYPRELERSGWALIHS